MKRTSTNKVWRSISRLKLFTKRLVEGFSTGLHRSPQRGASVTFKQHRPYVSGDEVRHIDWKVFARSDRYYVREYEQETSLRATLLVDLSGSMQYAGGEALQSKAEYAKTMALALGSLLIRQQDAVGLITFDTNVRNSIPSSSRPSQLQLMESILEQQQPGGETSLANTLKAAIPRLQKRGLLILISDCLEEPRQLARSLAQMRLKQHEVLVFQIFDKDELEFPFKGWASFQSLESPQTSLAGEAVTLRKQYLQNLKQYRSELSTELSRHGIELYFFTTNEPCETALKRHLNTRLKRS